jgi:hypothetical protein
LEEKSYIPGVCNIGKAEIQRRANKLKIAIVLILVITVWYLLIPFNKILFALLISISVYASILFFQIQNKFCIVYGMLSIFNFEEIGKRKKIENADFIKQDKRLVMKIVLYSLISTALFAFALILLKEI